MAEHPIDPTSSEAEPVLSTMLTESPELLTIVEQFVRSLPERIEAIQYALREQSFERVARLAHQLKGSGGSHGYADLTRQAGATERAAHAHTIDELTAKVGELSSLVARIQAGLQPHE